MLASPNRILSSPLGQYFQENCHTSSSLTLRPRQRQPASHLQYPVPRGSGWQKRQEANNESEDGHLQTDLRRIQPGLLLPLDRQGGQLADKSSTLPPRGEPERLEKRSWP